MNEQIFEIGILGKIAASIDRIGGEVCYYFLPLEPSVRLGELIKSKSLPRISVSMYAKLALTISATRLEWSKPVVLGQIDFSGIGKDYDELYELIFNSLEIMVSDMVDVSGTLNLMPKCSFLSKQGYALPSLIIRTNGTGAVEFWASQEGLYTGSRLCGNIQLGVLTASDL
ncbi:MAG: hypothetical protein WC621_03715 [Patescibacteria group bacterium]